MVIKSSLLVLWCFLVMSKMSICQNIKKNLALTLIGQLTISDRPKYFDRTAYHFKNTVSSGLAFSYYEVDKKLNREFQIGICGNRHSVIYDYTFDVFHYIQDQSLNFSTVSVKGGLNYNVAKKWTTGFSIGIGYRNNTAIVSNYDFSANSPPTSVDTIGLQTSGFNASEPYWVALSSFKINYIPSTSKKIILSLGYEFAFLHTYLERQELNVKWVSNTKTLVHNLKYLPTFNSLQLCIIYRPFQKQ